jgi:hypothetical protein
MGLPLSRETSKTVGQEATALGDPFDGYWLGVYLDGSTRFQMRAIDQNQTEQTN